MTVPTALHYEFVDFDPIVWTGRALQAESSEWRWLVLRFCIRPLCGADRSWPSWISARVRSHSQIGPRRPVGPPDHGRDGETVLHLLKSNSQTSAGVSYYQAAQGLTEAIPSEPPSLARPDRRATVAEKGGGHPFGEPERAHIAATLRRASYSRCCTSTFHAIRASLLARAASNWRRQATVRLEKKWPPGRLPDGSFPQLSVLDRFRC